MATRAEQLADSFDKTNQEFIAAVEACSDAEWRATCAGEGWPVGVTAHHVASSTEPVAGLVQAVANSQPLPPLTPEMLNQGNAQHAQQFANVGKAETLDLLRSKGPAASSAVRGLSDEQLGRSGTIFGNTMTTEQIIQGILIGHPQQHLQSMKSAQSGPA